MQHPPYKVKLDKFKLDKIELNKVKLAQQRAAQKRHRVLVVLQGDRVNGFKASEQIVSALHDPATPVQTLICQSYPRDHSPKRLFPNGSYVDRSNIQQLLGQENDFVIFDMFAGFNPNLLAAASGTLMSGGILFMITPALSDWAHFNDPEYDSFTDLTTERKHVKPRFLCRFRQYLKDTPECLILSTAEIFHHQNPSTTHNPPRLDLDIPTKLPKQKDNQPHASVEHAIMRAREQSPIQQTHEQQTLLDKLREDPAQVCIITADRGRGKSAAIGMHLAERIQISIAQKTPYRVIICASKKQMLTSLFHHFFMALTDLAEEANINTIQKQITQSHQPTYLQWANVSVTFLNPCKLNEAIESNDTFNLIIIDEAASIPYNLLSAWMTALQKHQHRPQNKKTTNIILSTTLDGYEGTGNSFKTRFFNLLQSTDFSWHHYELLTPIRWAAEDPLEILLNQALCLKPRIANNEAISNTPLHTLQNSAIANDTTDLTFHQWDPTLHLDIEAIYSLLLLAHYRTTPSDFRQLLDMPNQILIYTKNSKGAVMGVLWVTTEGGIHPSLCHDIKNSRRRLGGHFLPQTLLIHQHQIQHPFNHIQPEALAAKSYLRIMRIAVHPQRHSQGIGSKLVTQLLELTHHHRNCALSTSFGDSQPLTQFWTRLGFTTLRIGDKVSPITGQRSRLMVNWLTNSRKKHD